MGTPRSYRFRPAVNRRWAAIKKQMSAVDAKFLLHGGDVTRDGAYHEYEYQQAREDLDALPFPVFVIPGNMDVGNKHAHTNGAKTKWEQQGIGWDDRELNVTEKRLDLFARYFGPIQWSFVSEEVRFTGFYSAVAGSGLPQEAHLWRLLERLPDLPRTQYHVAVMHYWPFMEQPHEPDWDLTRADEYDNWYFSVSEPHRRQIWQLLRDVGVDILFCGHVHTGRPVQVADGIRVYRTAPAGNTSQLADRWPEGETRFGFHRCEVSADGIEVTFVPGSEQCEEFDSYGPMGHPPVAARDYSAAREQPALRAEE